MSDKLRTDFNDAERKNIISQLQDEFGNQKLSEELILLECQDLWRKGCTHLECNCCFSCEHNGDDCPLIGWEKRNPEYKDDALAKRLDELHDMLRAKNKAEIEKSLLAKGYIKVQWKQRKDGELVESSTKLYLPGSNELMVDIAKAIENWKNMWGCYFDLSKLDFSAKSGVLLELRVDQGDEYEIWEIIG